MSDRGEETSADRDAAPVRLPPPIVYLASLAVGALLQRYLVAIPQPFDGALRWIVAAVLLAGGLALLGGALGLFRQSGQNPAPWTATSELIGGGVYQWTRNPMYVGMALVQAAIGVAAANGWIVALVLVSCAIVQATAIRHEEAYLVRKFGAPYVAYQQRVRRWL
jgi:protein-S-isoprenylcysteine O-methyltransferase Ste14